MNRILAIDPGSNILGWAVTDNPKGIEYKIIDYGILKPKKGTEDPYCQINGEGFQNIYIYIEELIRRYKPDILVLENYGLSRRVKKGAFVVPKVQAIVQLLWWEHAKKETIGISSFTWKTHLVGNKLAKKEDIKNYLLKLKLVEESTVQDACDAIGQCIGYIYNKNSDMKKIQYRVKKVIKKKKVSKFFIKNSTAKRIRKIRRKF